MKQHKMTKVQIKDLINRVISLIMILIMMVTLAPSVNLADKGFDVRFGNVYADVTAGLQTSEVPIGYNKNGVDVFIDPGLTIMGISESINEARIMIRNLKNGDTLHYTTVHGIAGTYDAATGILSLSGETTAENYQTALRSVTFSTTSSDTGNRTIDFVLGSGLYFETTGHFYEYVSTTSNITWQASRAAAESRRFYGRQGYLVTITSAEENDFVMEKAEGIGWIGARDINRNVDSGALVSGSLSNGDWRWVTGPEGLEDNGNGLKFYSGYYPSSNPLPVTNVYNNWAVNEPNNYNPGEWVAHIFGKTVSEKGKWNDYAPSTGVRGYIVEYGGMSSDTPLVIQASKVITISETQIFSVTFKDYNGTTLKEETVEHNSSATAPSNPTRAGYTFAGWNTAFTNITADTEVIATYTANTDTAFKVEHYQENLSGGYDIFETDNLAGTTNTTATAIAKSYTGFSENTTHLDRVGSGNINGNGSTVLKLYYERNQYTIRFKNHDDSTITTQMVKYQGAATAPSNPTRAGYTFAGWFTDKETYAVEWNFDKNTVTNNIYIHAKWIKVLQVVNSINIDKKTKVETVNLKDKVKLPELDDDNVVVITVFLKADEIQIDESIKEKAETELAGKGYNLMFAFDIGLYKRVTTIDGIITETEILNEDITDSIIIRIPLNKQQAQKDNLAIAYVDDEGNVTIIEGIIESIGDKYYFTFETDHFSIYALVEINRESIPKTGQQTDRETRIRFLALMIGMGVLLISRRAAQKEKNTYL